MVMPYQLYLRDDTGEASINTINVEDGHTIGDLELDAVVAAVQGVSAAAVYKQAIRSEEVVAGDTAAANAYSIMDKAVMLFQTAAGTYFKWVIPAPLVAIFTDEDVVDEANALVQALITAALNTVTDNNGSPATDFVRGWRDRRNRTS